MKESEIPKKPLFLNYIHYLRGLAILLIVGIHCRISFSWEDTTQARIFESLLDNTTIIFVFISGFLFQHLFIFNFNYKNYLLKKLKFVILPYLLVSVLPILDKLYLEDQLLWLPSSLEGGNVFLKTLYMLGTGKHFGPFWFIPMIVLFYLIAPLLIKADNKAFYKFVFPLIFIFGLFTYQFGYYSSIFHSFVFFLPIYLFGMSASHYKERIIKNGTTIIIFATLIYVIISVFEVVDILEINKVVGFRSEDPQPYFLFNFSKLKVSIFCLALVNIFYLVRHKSMPLLKTLGEYSFGVYFIHLYIIIAYQKTLAYLNYDFHLNSITFLIYTFSITIICLAIVWTIKAIFKRNSRYLVGS